MAESPGAKHHGLRLSLGGAPNEAHHVPGYPGWYWPQDATPVGGEGEMSLEAARKADKDKGVPLELVDLTKAEADARRKEIAAFKAGARKALRNVTPLTSDEAERKHAEQLDAAGKET
jgi:glutaredoxin